MISFWVNDAGTFGMKEYIARRLPRLGELLQIHTYESLRPDLDLPRGTHIFGALCQLSPAGRQVVAMLYDRLREAAPEIRLLNDPRRVWRRFELLERMYAAGINQFRAYRASQADTIERFPVFVRQESAHEGALTGQLWTPKELAAALRSLRARGLPLDDLLVVEFRDMADRDGVIRMASVFKIGERLIPAFQVRGRRWVLKWNHGDQDEPAMREFLRYVCENPHAAWARDVFDRAGIDYGRMDFGVCGDTLQVWEINLNPTPGPSPGPEPAPLEAGLETMLQDGRRVYNAAMLEAFSALADCDRGSVKVRLEPALVDQMQNDLWRMQRRRARLGLLQSLYRSPALGWPIRAAYAWLVPRR